MSSSLNSIGSVRLSDTLDILSYPEATRDVLIQEHARNAIHNNVSYLKKIFENSTRSEDIEIASHKATQEILNLFERGLNHWSTNSSPPAFIDYSCITIPQGRSVGFLDYLTNVLTQFGIETIDPLYHLLFDGQAVFITRVLLHI